MTKACACCSDVVETEPAPRVVEPHVVACGETLYLQGMLAALNQEAIRVTPVDPRREDALSVFSALEPVAIIVERKELCASLVLEALYRGLAVISLDINEHAVRIFIGRCVPANSVTQLAQVIAALEPANGVCENDIFGNPV